MNRFKQLVRRAAYSKKTALLLTICAILTGIASYWYITENDSPLTTSPNRLIGITLINLAVLLALLSVVLNRVYRSWQEVKQGFAGSRLQTRIITMFCLGAIIPAIIVSVFSAAFFNYGIKSWFDNKVSTALKDSLLVAEAYLAEHKEVLRADAQAMAGDLGREVMGTTTHSHFANLVSAQAAIRSLTEAVVFQHNRIVASSQLTFSLAFEKLPFDAIKRADSGEVVIITDDDDDRVRALVKIDGLNETYLLVGRFVDSKVLDYMNSTRGAVNEYLSLQQQISGLQIKFIFVFIVVAMVVILATVWYGIIFATDLVKPLRGLISASEKISEGDYSVRVQEKSQEISDDEISHLAKSFNRMTSELERQRGELIDVNHELDTRRKFIEAVLSGVSAGVIAVDSNLKVSLINRSAIELLGILSDNIEQLSDISSEINSIIVSEAKGISKPIQKEISINSKGVSRILHIRIAKESSDDSENAYIITFDDVTDLILAQRTSAWADVARRIAHEIKNPLTPIQLSAERIRRKYVPDDLQEKESFTKYIDTITRHVADIGKMVEEFVSFARLPSPELSRVDVAELIKKTIFSEQIANSGVKYTTRFIAEKVYAKCDPRMIGQVLTNLLKNASESLIENKIDNPEITISMNVESDFLFVEIADNGNGYPEEILPRITEPYVTTRAKGTGLGLAICKRIVEEHGGKLTLTNRTSGGALATFSLGTIS